MAHDAKGTELKIGDKVLIPGTITGIAPTDEYCNCAVDLEHFMPPEQTVTTLLNLNTRQVEKSDRPDLPAAKTTRPVPAAQPPKVEKAEKVEKTEKVKVNGD